MSVSLNDTLQDYGGDFEAMVEALGSSFKSATELFESIASSEKILMSFDATIDFNVTLDMSLDDFMIVSSLNEFRTAFTADIADEFSIPLGSRPWNLGIEPQLTLSLEANNTAVPFDVFQYPNKLSEFIYDGQIEALIIVGVEGVPAEVSLKI